MSGREQFEAVPNPLIPQPDFKVPADLEDVYMSLTK